MNENHDLLSILKKNNIYDFAVLNFKNEFVLHEYKLKSLKFSPKTIIVCLFPSYFGELPKDANLSRFASTMDYHLIVGKILENACEQLKSIYKDSFFGYFVDNSPFLEKDMACKGGLCIKGKHDICINDKYGTQFFIGEIVTDFEFEQRLEITKAMCCDAAPCIKACPTGAIYIDENNNSMFNKDLCLSYISQKKVHTKQDEQLFLKAKTIWGCDICQDACVKNNSLKTTHIKEFLDIMPNISLDDIENKSDNEFKNLYHNKAFSWRGKEILERNLKFYKHKKIT